VSSFVSRYRDGARAALAVAATVWFFGASFGLVARAAGMGVLAPLFHGRLPRRLLESQLIVDESWALASRGGGRFDRRILLGAGLLLYVSWVSGTAVGVLAGDALGDPKDLGLDGAFPALFLALLAPQLRAPRAAMAAAVGAVIAFALIPVTPAGTPIIAASAACLLGLRRRP